MEACLQKETIIEVFEREKLHVEINENKNGNVVVSRMCELYKHQVFADDRPWDDNVEKAIKDKVNLTVKPDLRKIAPFTDLQRHKENPADWRGNRIRDRPRRP